LSVAAPPLSDGAKRAEERTASFAPRPPPPSAPGRALFDGVLRGDVWNSVRLQAVATAADGDGAGGGGGEAFSLEKCLQTHTLYECMRRQKEAIPTTSVEAAAARTTTMATTRIATTTIAATTITTTIATTTIATTTIATTTIATTSHEAAKAASTTSATLNQADGVDHADAKVAVSAIHVAARHVEEAAAETGHAAPGPAPAPRPAPIEAPIVAHGGRRGRHAEADVRPARGRRAPKWGPLKVWDEGEEFHHVSDRDFAVACLLFGALAFDMVILHMVNWQDPHVRSYIYKMISATVSIFLGVLLNQTIFIVFMRQLLPAPWPGGLGLAVGPRTQLVFGLFLFTVAFACVNVFGYLSRGYKQQLHAVVVLGGHIIAFAGITMFGNLQVVLYPRYNWISCVVPIALLTLLAYSTTSKLIRTQIFGRFDFDHTGNGNNSIFSPSNPGARGYEQVPVNENAAVQAQGSTSRFASMRNYWQEPKDPEEDEWREGVCEAEDEAAVLIMSFLSSQALILWLTNELMPLQGIVRERPNMKVIKILVLSLVFMMLLFVTSVWRSRIPTSTEFGNINDPTSLYMRAVRGVQNFWGCCMSWCLLRAGEWVLHGAMSDHSILKMVNAILMTGIAIVSILGLDALADWMRPEQDRKASYKPRLAHGLGIRPGSSLFGTPTNPNPQLRRQAQSDWSLEADKPLKDRVGELQWSLKDKLDELHETTLNLSNLERAVRTLINGMGLLVGMCWEKAFDSSNETIIHGAEVMRGHVIRGEVLMALGTMLLVLPAWVWFIAPSASKHWREHMQIMEIENIQAQRVAGTQVMAHFLSIAKTLNDDELAVALGDLLERRVEVREVIMQEDRRRSLAQRSIRGSVWETMDR